MARDIVDPIRQDVIDIVYGIYPNTQIVMPHINYMRKHFYPALPIVEKGEIINPYVLGAWYYDHCKKYAKEMGWL